MREREQKGGSVGCFIMGVVAFMLLPMYVLSIGPFVWLAERNEDVQWIGVIYAPIGFLASIFPPVDRALTWYLDRLILMKEQDEKRGGSGCAIGLVALLFLLPVLYVFSIGPASWLFLRGYTSIGIIDPLYAPLYWAADNVELFGNFLAWYLGLFG